MGIVKTDQTAKVDLSLHRAQNKDFVMWQLYCQTLVAELCS